MRVHLFIDVVRYAYLELHKWACVYLYVCVCICAYKLIVIVIADSQWPSLGLKTNAAGDLFFD